MNNTSTIYTGSIFEVQKDAGGATIAVRTVVGEEDSLQWILSDHLSSASVTANEDGTWNSRIQYTAFGEVRASSGLTAMQYPQGAKRPEGYEVSLHRADRPGCAGVGLLCGEMV